MTQKTAYPKICGEKGKKERTRYAQTNYTIEKGECKMDIKIDVTIGMTEDVKTFLQELLAPKFIEAQAIQPVAATPGEEKTTKRSHHKKDAPETPAAPVETPDTDADSLSEAEIAKLKKVAIAFKDADAGNKAVIKKFLENHKTARITELDRAGAKEFIALAEAADDNGEDNI